MASRRRPYRRFPVQCFVRYSTGPFTGVGTIWNLPMTGWRMTGDLPLRRGESFSLTVSLPNDQFIPVLEATVRWVRQNEYGIETTNIGPHDNARLEHYIKRLVRGPVIYE